MKRFWIFFISIFFIYSTYASNCPDPETTSLKWGEVPPPWVVSPYSQYPQADDNTRFVRANILIAGIGRGVSCTYHNSAGDFTIFLETATKIPSRNDPNWIEVVGGFVCTQSLSQCQFSIAALQ